VAASSPRSRPSPLLCAHGPSQSRDGGPFGESLNWFKGADAKGSPIPNPDKDPKLDGKQYVMVPAGDILNAFYLQ